MTHSDNIIKKQNTEFVPSHEQDQTGPSFTGLTIFLSLLYGFVAAMAWGLLFGALSLVTIIIGVVGSLAAGVIVSTAVTAPFKRIGGSLKLTLFPVSFILTVLSTLVMILGSFIIVIYRKDGDASFFTALDLAWTFYKLSLTDVGSSLIITIVGVLSGILGYLGRLNGLRRRGRLA